VARELINVNKHYHCVKMIAERPWRTSNQSTQSFVIGKQGRTEVWWFPGW